MRITIKILIIPMCIVASVGYGMILNLIGMHDLTIHALVGATLGVFGTCLAIYL